jgi:hypothetical protein
MVYAGKKDIPAAQESGTGMIPFYHCGVEGISAVQPAAKKAAIDAVKNGVENAKTQTKQKLREKRGTVALIAMVIAVAVWAVAYWTVGLKVVQ